MYSEKNLADIRVKDFYWVALFWDTAAAVDLIVGWFTKKLLKPLFLTYKSSKFFEKNW